MASMRITMRALGGMAMMAGAFTSQAQAQIKAEDVLARRPVQVVAVSTPAPAEMAACKVEQVAWPKGGSGVAPTGVKVTDSNGKLLRQFIDTNGGTKFNIFSYYLEGVEAYREIDSNASGTPDQFRWLGTNGGKWGTDRNKDGIVDTWHILSPEELSQELFAAVITKDPRRLQALMPTDDDLAKLGLPAADVEKLKNRTANAANRLLATTNALKLTDKAKWVHLELGVPSTTPGDAFGGKDDLVKHRNSAVLVDRGDNKAELFQTGELILVGRAWKLIEGPAVGPPATGEDVDSPPIPEDIKPLFGQLVVLKQPTKQDEVYPYHMARASILEKIVEKTQGAVQVPWLKQLIDAYAAAVEANPMGDKAALPRLDAWKKAILITPGATETQGYVTIRCAAAEYAVRMTSAKGDAELKKVHAWWREQLDTFVKTYPTSSEAADTLMRLSVAHEFDGKDGDAGAKAAYEKLAKDYPNHPLAAKAAGAVRRLNSEGELFTMQGTTLDGKPFTQANLAGKAAVIYYWASWGNGAAAELKALAEIEKTVGPKGVVIVTVSLDDDAAKATGVITAAQLPGFHLHAAGGLDRSPLANAYGVQMVPHVMLIGKDGKVVNRSAQNGDGLKSEIEKLVK